jgi:exonuclease VII small subunit
MKKVIKFPRLNIWTLVRIHRDLEEITDKLDHIAFDFDQGRLNFSLFEEVMSLVKRCRYRLENALAERRNLPHRGK